MSREEDLLVHEGDAVCTLVINRPDQRNLLTPGCLLKIRDVMYRLSQDGRVRAVVLRGAGDRAFSAGYDIAALPTQPTPETAGQLLQTPPLEQALQAIRDFPYPVIAMVNGDAYGGGCELAVGCDIRIAATHVKMGMPPAKLGLVYPYDGYRRFLTVLGFSRTLELFLTGRAYDSRACLDMGLVNRIVEKHRLESVTHELSRELSENSPLSLKGTKTALYKIARYPILDPEDEASLRALFVESLKSRDMEEGKQAFMEKRKPRFQGK